MSDVDADTKQRDHKEDGMNGEWTQETVGGCKAEVLRDDDGDIVAVRYLDDNGKYEEDDKQEEAIFAEMVRRMIDEDEAMKEGYTRKMKEGEGKRRRYTRKTRKA